MDIGSISPVYRPVATQDLSRLPGQNPADGAASDLASTAVVQTSGATLSADDRRTDNQDSGSDLDHRVIIDPDTQDIVFQSVDDVTQSVVRQYPDQAMLRRKAYFVKLDKEKTAQSDAPAGVERRI